LCCGDVWNACCFFVKGNVLKELVSPAGAVIHVSEFQLGDPTLSVLEIWGAEYQESNALLVRSEHRSLLQSISAREKCPVSFVGQITGTGRVKFHKKLFCSLSIDMLVALRLVHSLSHFIAVNVFN